MCGELRPLPDGHELAAYRIFQEALTNAVRHASGSSVRVTLDYGPEELVVEVADDGPGLAAREVGGHGLAGIRERATLAGGALDIMETPGGGWTVQASLPYPGGGVRSFGSCSRMTRCWCGLRMILETEPDLKVVGAVGDGLSAVRQATAQPVDVVLMDIKMPGVDGIEATRRITSAPEQCPRALVLTTHDADEFVFDALRAGASGRVSLLIDA